MSKSISKEKRMKIIIDLFSKAIYEGLTIPHENFINNVHFFLKLNKDEFTKFFQQDYRFLIYFCIQIDNRFSKQAYIPERIKRNVYKEDVINEILEKRTRENIALYLDNLCLMMFETNIPKIIVDTDFIELSNFFE